jgi:cyclopropane fatty-acyl-phospholipid synthase-like methyltransferase
MMADGLTASTQPATARFWSIRSASSEIENPIAPERLESVAEVVRPKLGMSVLDVGCGKAWLLRRWAAVHQVTGIGLELNPHYVAEARRLTAVQGLSDSITVIESAALDFNADPASFDAVLCLGATSALGGPGAALPWLCRVLKADGALVIGVAYRRGTAQTSQAAVLPTLSEIIVEIEGNGLEITTFLESSRAEWDAFRSRQFANGDDWLRANRDDSQWPQVAAQLRAARARYFEWQRDEMQWGLFVMRQRATQG